jgi:hydroxymethylpyrimidine pyrophosphatase-like HAD family hydrolase
MGKEKIKVLIFDYDGTLVNRNFRPLFRLIKLNKDKKGRALEAFARRFAKNKKLKNNIHKCI